MRKQFIVATVLQVVCLVTSASAHYLWVTVDESSGKHGTTNIYFEGGAAPGDGRYLDPFLESGKTWIRTVANPEPTLIDTVEATAPNQRWLSAMLPASSPRSIDSYGKFGVYRYGKTDVLLHYYGRLLEVQSSDDLQTLARSKQLDLDIVPKVAQGEMELTVLWKGKPAAGRSFNVRGPKASIGKFETNASGIVHFPIGDAGIYAVRTSFEEEKSGKDGDDDYTLIRHNATLRMALPVAEK